MASSLRTVYFDLISNRFVYESTGQKLDIKDFLNISYKQQLETKWIFGEVDDDGVFAAVDLTQYAITTWQSSIDDDFSSASDPMCRTLDANIDDSEASSGILYITYDADTAGFFAAIDGVATGKKAAYIEVQGYEVGGDLVFHARSNDTQLIAKALIDPTGGDPPDPVGNYYTKTEADARYLQFASSSSSTLTDSATTNILLFDKTVYRSVRFDGVLDDGGGNYNQLCGYIKHNGTTAIQLLDLDDYPAEITGLTITADISGDSVRLNIANASGGDVELDYILYNYITIA